MVTLMEQLILVDRNDKVLGYGEKMECHSIPTKLHRAISVFIFNDGGEMLIHKRAQGKKTWPGFWTNACCSHPLRLADSDESHEHAAKRRTMQELGIEIEPKFLFKFEYKADYDREWGENELDWVFAAKHNGAIKPDKNEVEEWKYISKEELKKEVKKNPEKYTPWFKIALDRVLELNK